MNFSSKENPHKFGKWLILRRLTQCGILALFAWAAGEIVRGNLSSSEWFEIIPLSDPFALLQLFLAGLFTSFGALGLSAVLGGVLILAFYAIFAGRAFCAWVCPINLITDFAAFIRRKFHIESKFFTPHRNTRYFILALSLLMSIVLGTAAFESISYIGIVQRGIILGTAAWLGVAFLIFVFDSFVSPKGLCSHLCPLGAFYAIVSKFSLLKIKYELSKCSKCFNCVGICPEKQVLSLISHESGFVKSGECLRCGRCVEVCNDDALNFSILNLRRTK